MSTWLYQLNQENWTPQRYRLEVWEGQAWQWEVRTKVTQGHAPIAGDSVTFFYAKSGGTEAGFYGWAVILEWLPFDQTSQMTFRPVAPSDHLKMDPWWNPAAEKLADAIRRPIKQGTLWYMEEDLSRRLRSGVAAWLSAKTKR
jgi:hypothetical protein